MLLRKAALLDRDAALPISEAGEGERNDQARCQAAGEDIAPARRRLPAAGDEGLRLLRGRGRAGRSRGDPALGFLQRGRAQQQPGGRFGKAPAARLLAELRVLADPADVGRERLGEAVGALLEMGGVVEEDEVELRKGRRHALVIDRATDDGRKAFVQRRGEGDLLERHLRGDRIRTQHEHHGVGAGDQILDARPPVLESVDLGAIDQRRKAARCKRRFQPIGEGHVLAGIGDEHPRLGCVAIPLAGVLLAGIAQNHRLNLSGRGARASLASPTRGRERRMHICRSHARSKAGRAIEYSRTGPNGQKPMRAGGQGSMLCLHSAADRQVRLLSAPPTTRA